MCYESDPGQPEERGEPTTTIAIIGAGSVGRALGTSLAAAGHRAVYGVRNVDDPRYADLSPVADVITAVRGADVVVLAIPAAAVPGTVPGLGLAAGQVVLDTTNAVRMPVPDGFPTMGDLVASLVPEGVAVAKAFNSVGAEHLGNGRTPHGPVFLPVAGDPAAVDAAAALAADLGHEPAVLGGREAFALSEEHARLWIHLAFARGWGRRFAFTVVRS